MRYRAFAAALVWAVANLCLAAPIGNRPSETDPAPTEERPQEVLDAIKKYEGGDTKGAFELLKTAVGKHPNLAPARLMLANLFFTDHHPEAGLAELEQAAVEAPSDPEPHLIFGDIAVSQHRVSDAEAQYQTGRRLLDGYSGSAARKAILEAQCALGLAQVAKQRADWPTAQKYLQPLVTAQPKNAGARLRLAEALVGQSKPDDALKHLEAATAADPKLPPPADLMADVYFSLGISKEGARWLSKAVQDSPADVRTHLALARWQMDNGALADARKEAEAAEKIDAKSTDVKLILGLIARYENRSKDAKKLLTEVLDQSPGNVAASNQLALLLAEDGDTASLRRALEMTQANLRSRAASSETAAAAGWISYKLGVNSDAERLFSAALSSGRVSRDAAYFMAAYAWRRGQKDDARKLARQAIDGQGPFANLEPAKKLLEEMGSKETAPK